MEDPKRYAARWTPPRQDAESDFEVLGTLAEQGDLHDRFVSWMGTV